MSDVVELFISHKSEDRELACTLKEELEMLAPGRLVCILSEKFAGGTDWREKIHQCLGQVELVLLLFTTSSTEWDWPLFEVGVATDTTNPDRCRIVCFYPADSKPPEPIRAYQHFAATPDSLVEFLHQLFRTDQLFQIEQVLNDRLTDERLMELAAKISDLFTVVEPWEKCYTRYLWIEVEDALANDDIASRQIPGTATIHPKSTAIKLFGLEETDGNNKPWQWSELLNRVDADAPWIAALGERCKWAAERSILRSMNKTFRSPQDERVYRPLLHRANLCRDGSMRFEVIFTDVDDTNA